MMNDEKTHNVTSSFCLRPSSFKKWRVAALPLALPQSAGRVSPFPAARRFNGGFQPLRAVVQR
jgi:hypothetical protein